MAKKPIQFEVDASLLSDDEIQSVQAEVQAEADKEAKDAAKASLRKKLLAEARTKKGLAEQQVKVTVDLAPYTDRILIDNVAFLQGVTYTVPASKAAVMNEMMQRTWGHQAEIDGKSENFYRKTRGQRVVPAGDGAAVVTTSSLLRA